MCLHGGGFFWIRTLELSNLLVGPWGSLSHLLEELEDMISLMGEISHLSEPTDFSVPSGVVQALGQCIGPRTKSRERLGLHSSFLKSPTTSEFKIMYKDLMTRGLPARVEPGMRGRRGERLLHHDL